jgi:EAL domain-containing protein (putative c-di-GMP-specific phosphodiesterase class I)
VETAVQQRLLQAAGCDEMQGYLFSRLPVVRVGRGSPEGFADPHDYFIAGSNLTSTPSSFRCRKKPG